MSKDNGLTAGEELWLELYAAIFARSKHEVLFKAMASLDLEEKRIIDDNVTAIIDRFLHRLPRP